MRTADSSRQWKGVGKLEFLGIVLLIPISFMAFSIIVGVVFSRFLDSNPETASALLLAPLYLCLGCGIATFIYRLSRSYLIILCSLAVLFLFQLLIMVSFNQDSVGVVIRNVLPDLFWAHLSMVLCVFLFRYSEATLDFAEAKDVKEKTEKKTNRKYSYGTCTKCGGETVVSRQRESTGSNKIEFFCDRCGRFVRGNPLPDMLIGVVLVTISALTLYGLNWKTPGSLISAFNLLCLIILFVGAKTFHSGLRWTIHSIAKKPR